MSVPVPFYYNQYTAKERSYVDYMGSIAEANALFTKEIQSTLVSNQLATETALYNHTRQLDRTLDAGFSAVSRELGHMGSTMSMGFASLNSAVEKSSRAICEKLDDINETLKNPLYTESRELYNRAFRNYNKTLYEEALEDLKEAVKKNKTDPFSHFLMAQTYLYGISEFGNVINLEKAVESLVNAAKYITPDARSHAEIKPMAAEIYFYLGLACQTKANDDIHNGNESDYKNYLEKAKDAYGKSWDYSRNMFESLYNLARCKALSGEADGAETDLMTLMVKDPGYFVKVFTESDFNGAFRDKLKGRIKQEVYPTAKALFDRMESAKAELGDAISPELAARLPAAFTESTPPFDILEGNLHFPAMLTAIDDEQKRKLAAMLQAQKEQERKHTAILQAHIAASSLHTVGLKKDGTVIAVGDNSKGQCNTRNWSDIIAIAAGNADKSFTVGLKRDGTVIAVGDNYSGQCNTQDWQDITAIAAASYRTVGLKKDGTVVAVGYNKPEESNTQNWRDIIAIAAAGFHTVGLKKDGTVVAVGDDKYGQCNTRHWRDIVAITAGDFNTVGLKEDGTVIVAGRIDNGQSNTQKWRDIIAIAAGGSHTVGLKKDGTVVAVGYNFLGQCNIQDWRDIIAIAAGGYQYSHTVGLKKDGTVVAVGDKGHHKCDTQNWRDIGQSTEQQMELKGEQHEAALSEQSRAEQQSKEWEAQGLCRYCGGKIGGLFSKKCTACGKPQ